MQIINGNVIAYKFGVHIGSQFFLHRYTKTGNGNLPKPTFTTAKVQLFSETAKNILMKFIKI